MKRGQTCLPLFKVVALVQVAHRGRLGRGLFTAATAPTKLEEWHFVIYTLQSRLDDVFFVPLKHFTLQYLCLESSPPQCT